MTDDQIMSLFQARPDRWLYARGHRDGSADYSRWHITHFRSAPIEYEQVRRLVAAKKLVALPGGKGACFCLQSEASRFQAALDDHARKSRR